MGRSTQQLRVYRELSVGARKRRHVGEYIPEPGCEMTVADRRCAVYSAGDVLASRRGCAP